MTAESDDEDDASDRLERHGWGAARVGGEGNVCGVWQEVGWNHCERRCRRRQETRFDRSSTRTALEQLHITARVPLKLRGIENHCVGMVTLSIPAARRVRMGKLNRRVAVFGNAKTKAERTVQARQELQPEDDPGDSGDLASWKHSFAFRPEGSHIPRRWLLQVVDCWVGAARDYLTLIRSPDDSEESVCTCDRSFAASWSSRTAAGSLATAARDRLSARPGALDSSETSAIYWPE